MRESAVEVIHVAGDVAEEGTQIGVVLHRRLAQPSHAPTVDVTAGDALTLDDGPEQLVEREMESLDVVILEEDLRNKEQTGSNNLESRSTSKCRLLRFEIVVD